MTYPELKSIFQELKRTSPIRLLHVAGTVHQQHRQSAKWRYDMKFEKQNQPLQQYGLTPLGLQTLRDAADPGKPHDYEWYVIGSINTPEERMERTPSLEDAIQIYTALDCANKRLGVEKDGIAAVDLVIRHNGREWISEDRLKLDRFKSDPVVAAVVAEIRKTTGAAIRLTLTLLGRDSRSRPVYEGSDGSLYVDTDPSTDRQPKICTKCRNDFDGVPDTPVHAEFIFVPRRDTW